MASTSKALRRLAPDTVRNWTAINAAQANEKRHVKELAREICGCLDEPTAFTGRPPLLLRDMIWCLILKTCRVLQLAA